MDLSLSKNGSYDSHSVGHPRKVVIEIKHDIVVSRNGMKPLVQPTPAVMQAFGDQVNAWEETMEKLFSSDAGQLRNMAGLYQHTCLNPHIEGMCNHVTPLMTAFGNGNQLRQAIYREMGASPIPVKSRFWQWFTDLTVVCLVNHHLLRVEYRRGVKLSRVLKDLFNGKVDGWTLRVPTQASLEYDLKVAGRKHYKRHESKPIDRAAFVCEWIALLPISHLILTSYLQLHVRNPLVEGVLTALLTPFLGMLLNAAVKEGMQHMMSVWWDHGSESETPSKLTHGISMAVLSILFPLVIAVVALSWFGQDLAFLQGLILTRKVKMLLSAAPVAAAFFVSTSLGASLNSAFKTARYERKLDKSTRGDTEFYRANHALAAALPESEEEANALLQSAVTACIQLQHELERFQWIFCQMTTLPKTRENYLKLVSYFADDSMNREKLDDDNASAR